MKPNKFLTTLTLLLGITLSLSFQSCSTTKSSQNKGTTGKQSAKVANDSEVASLYEQIEQGGEIKLPKRTYYLDRPLVIMNQNDLVLDGNSSIFIMKDKNEDVMTIRSSTNITLKNFKATHIEPEGPIGCTGSVIQLDGNNAIMIKNCQLNGSGIIGVVAYNTTKLAVQDCYIYNNSQYGILFDENTSLEIKGNQFEYNGQGGKNHVGKALNAYLSEVEAIGEDVNRAGLKMSGNTFK